MTFDRRVLASAAVSGPELSPPGSQGDIVASSTPNANANGKRPLSTIDSNGDSQPGTRNTQLTMQPPEAETKTHAPSGYTWSRPEDEPGHSFLNKRAIEEKNRAWDNVLHKDRRIGDRYGDPFEMVDEEAAILASSTSN